MTIAPLCTAEDAAQLTTLTLPHRDLTIRGFSKAAARTAWAVPELKMAFDCGFHVPSFTGIPALAITHAHPDHLAGIVSLIATRCMLKAPLTKVFVPRVIEGEVHELFAVWAKLTGRPYDLELIPVEAGERYALGHGKFLLPFRTAHVIPSLGYRIVEARRHLKPVLAGLTGVEIGRRRQGGEDVYDAIDVCHVAFTGDTNATVLDATPELYSARVLIMECTYIGKEQGILQAREYGHTHLDEIAERAASFKNELLVLAHFSARYTRETILAEVEKTLPRDLCERTAVWI